MTPDELLKKYLSEPLRGLNPGGTRVYPVPVGEMAALCRILYFDRKLQLKTITAADERREGQGFKVYYVFGVPGENRFLAPYLSLKGEEAFPSLTREIHEASGYERKIMSFFGLEPRGHPHPRPLLLQENWPEGLFPLRKDFDWQQRPPEGAGRYDFQKVEGEGIYEIPVGPVHAGIIEPGHFRFSVAGEEILLLEPRLGYKHKGIEKLFEVLPLAQKVRLSERVSGDTSFTHALAFCQAVEKLAGLEIPSRASYLRVVFSELERLANHLNDIGFIMLDTGYSFGGSHGARLREMIMQWNERLTGSRFLRGVNTIGGVTRDIPADTGRELLNALNALERDFAEVMAVARRSSSLRNRLAGTGKLDRQIALDHGVIGPAGRALGLAHDARSEYPYAAYPRLRWEMALEEEGDVLARWSIRIKEVQMSLALIEQAIGEMPPGNTIQSTREPILPGGSCAMGMAEGWRGDIVYFVLTDGAGQISRVEVRDPSFLNWTVLGHAGKGNIIPDFPLINKSFNLSYSGNDL
jgi:Ni,Fe-hydrogenase III large subunit/Ni,Fe-hydrogenase III component G